ncbi:DUF4365 domain-containing protein [Terasakiella sp. A23]|uniref:DUF4365 domain-containing protein n=1 Tax=Terasakiella sp. FCG-A23 TaxID=3080561 RepID=UPI002952EBC8|nr:DUF4365 domain-containing protein [Terasakiella sp. A23]MDV7341336.1 DUF4365 domain-containing protein [Terasakiella sp. A23]
MNATEIGIEAGRIFQYNLPNNWIYRSQEDQDDFGIDGEIELKNEIGKALGSDSVFKIQIKGEENSNYINNGKVLSFTLKVEKLNYYFEFNIPVILIVVEVSSEKVYWLPLTNNEELRRKANISNQNRTIQIHLPVENILERRNEALANNLIQVVSDCWGYLAIKGLENEVKRYPTLSPSKLEDRIQSTGDALYKAHHQKLNNLLSDKKFEDLYQTASEILKSPIVPASDRFIALLYYWQAFQIAPFKQATKDILEENFGICNLLIHLAREQKSKAHRLIAIGKSRSMKFKFQLDQLYATHHSINHFEKNSLEHFIFNSQTHEMYKDCCLSLQKIIHLCNRLTLNDQFDILAGVYADICGLIGTFQSVHTARGAKESVEFLEGWHESTLFLVLSYCLITKDVFKLKKLYLEISLKFHENNALRQKARNYILSSLPEFKSYLDHIEKSVKETIENRDFFSLPIEEQKALFTIKAKNLGMDPDDPEAEYGHIIETGLKNYDPTDIMKNCESLFVHYRPGGIIAQSLGMHSAGGMHLLICLKHGHAQGTGNLLSELYDRHSDQEFLRGFKQYHCESCLDCQPREKDWVWSLMWYQEAVEENKELLGRYKF